MMTMNRWPTRVCPVTFMYLSAVLVERQNGTFLMGLVNHDSRGTYVNAKEGQP
jgi:hypothetical protein